MVIGSDDLTQNKTDGNCNNLVYATCTTGRTKGAVVREALELFIAAEAQQAKVARTALDRLRPYVGSISTGGAQLSTDTHEKFRDALIRKSGVRRSR